MILCVGGDSEVGFATYRLLKVQGEPVAATTRRPDRVAADRPFLDLAASLADWSPPSGTRTACIFAAVARLAACAEDPVYSAHINVVQTLVLIDRLIECGVAVLFLSTNQVFDGNMAHVPVDAMQCPISVYGKQKAHVEAVLQTRMATAPSVAILRLAKVLSPDMSIIHGWIDALSTGQPIRTFYDMPVAPVPSALVVKAICSLLHDRASGIYHLTGPRDVTYAEVGHYVADRLDANRALVTETGVAAAGLPEGANPRNTTLDSSLLSARYGLVVPDAWQVIDQLIADQTHQIARHELPRT